MANPSKMNIPMKNIKKSVNAKAGVASKSVQDKILEKVQQHDIADKVLDGKFSLLNEKVEKIDRDLIEMKHVVSGIATNMSRMDNNLTKMHGVMDKILSVAKLGAWVITTIVTLAAIVIKFV